MNIIRERFLVRVMVTCFVGIHTPLIVMVALHLATGDQFDRESIGVLLLATLLGTGATLYVLQREIMPVIRISRALESFADRREIIAIDHAGSDEIGALARSAAWAIGTADVLLRRTEHEALTDSLTELPNRRAFLECAAARAGGSIAILDLDCFKSINDTHGHQTGDHVLRTIASLLRDTLRGSDVVARLGGEEFAVLLPDSDPDQAVEVLDRARAALMATRVLHDRAITFSAGVTGRTGDIQADMAHADRAMYRAKHAGRNRVVILADPADRRLIDAPPMAADPAFAPPSEQKPAHLPE